MATGAPLAFADSEEDHNNLDRKYMSDYSIESQIADDTFNPGQFTVEFAMNAVDWLGVSGKSGTVLFKTGASPVSISEQLPNLKTFIEAEQLAKASMVGNTFTCSNTPAIQWSGEGTWNTVIDAPAENIRFALDELKNYLTVTHPGVRQSDEPSVSPEFFDNMIMIKAGSSLQYGTTKLTFTKDCDIDELYDSVWQKNYYESTFAENIYRIQQATTLETVSDSKVRFDIAQGSFLQFCESKFLANQDIDISIEGASAGGADPLTAVNTALATAKNTGEAYTDDYYTGGKSSNPHSTAWSGYNDVHAAREYYIHECDIDQVFESGFGYLNELLGVLADNNAKIVVVAADSETEHSTGRTDASDPAVSAEIKITSAPGEVVKCTHANTVVKDKVAPTFTTVGYSGDTYCADCGQLLKEGTILAKKASSIKLNYKALKLKVKQSTSVLKVTFVKGDAIKSVKSNKTAVVKAVKSGTNKIKLTAGSKTGKATVTVVLKSGKKATVTVTVQKKAVACTSVKVTSGTSVTLKKGKTHQIKVTRYPVTCVQKVTYKSSNKKVATVTSKGKVKAKKKGTAKITVKCGSKKKVVKIKVK